VGDVKAIAAEPEAYRFLVDDRRLIGVERRHAGYGRLRDHPGNEPIELLLCLGTPHGLLLLGSRRWDGEHGSEQKK
jgi:hypothetical protein